MGEDEYETSVDGTRTGHHAVAEILLLLHAEVGAAVEFEHVVFLETTFVQEHIDTLAGRVFTALVLLLDGFLTATQARLFTLGNQLLDFF